MGAMTLFGRAMARQRARTAVAVLAVVLLAACSADATDFRTSAERFIEGDTMSAQAGTDFTDATCDQPDGTEVGTTFECTAVAADAVPWVFEVTIVDDADFQITGRPNPSA